MLDAYMFAVVANQNNTELNASMDKCLYGLAPLLIQANTRCPPTLTEPFNWQLPNCGTVFRQRSETFRALHLLRELSKCTFLR